MKALKKLKQYFSTTAAVEKMIKEFTEQFPGKCIICSYHAYGIREGIIPYSPVEEHNCCENMERWK